MSRRPLMIHPVGVQHALDASHSTPVRVRLPVYVTDAELDTGTPIFHDIPPCVGPF
jgi:hypothetical protein